MGALKDRYVSLCSTINTLYESLEVLNDPTYQEIYKTCRDSVIQRFKYSIDTLWKFLKAYLQQDRGVLIEVSSPREIFRLAQDNKLLSQEEFEIMMKCVVARNLSSHTYREEVAEDLVKMAPSCCDIMRVIVDRIEIK